MPDKNGDKKDEKIKDELKKFPLLNIEYDLYYHGIKPLKKIDLSRLKYLSIVFVALGLISIYYLATVAPAIYASIQDVYGNYLYNYAVVVIEGNITDIPSVRIDSQGRFAVYFTISDGTGSLSARIYDPLARQALAQGKVPGVGDHVKAEVQVRVIETYTYGIVQSLDSLKITRIWDAQKPMKVDSLSTDMVGRYVEIKGSIIRVRKASSGLYLIDVNTGADTIVVVLPNYLEYVNGTLDPETNTLYPNPEYQKLVNSLVIGAEVVARGVVHLYRSMPELVVNRLSDFVVKTEVAENTTIDKIVFENQKYVGKFVVLNNVWLGEVSYDSRSGNYMAEIYDDTYHTTAIFLSYDFRNAFNPFTTGTGSRLTIVGAVCNDSSIAVVDYNITERRPAPLMTPSEVSWDMMGYIVALEGIVVLEPTQTQTESYGCPICDYYHGVSTVGSIYRFQLADPDDPDIKITVFMPGSAFNYLDPELKELLKTNGSRVIVAGYITEYRDELEIVVYSSEGVMSPTETPPGAGLGLPERPRYKPVNIITKVSDAYNMLGEEVILDVIVDKIEFSAGWVILDVHDDTGSIQVYITSSELRKLNPFRSAIGSEIIVGGIVSGRRTRYIQATEISVYNGNPAPLVKVSDLTSDYTGKIVAMKGVITQVSENYDYFYIDDGTGAIRVEIMSGVTLTDEAKSLITVGRTVVVAGIYRQLGATKIVEIYSPEGIKPEDYTWQS